jgi:DNA modification methylase
MAFWKGALENSETNYYAGRYPKAVLDVKKNESIKSQFGWEPLSIYRPGKGNELRKFIDDKGEIRDDLEEGRKVRKKATKRFGEVKISEFLPELCTTIIRYWSMPGDLIVDPFAGRATRGILSRMLDRRYRGYEIAPTTWRHTSKKVEAVGGKVFCADGCQLAHTKDGVADLVMTSPPYFAQEGHEQDAGGAQLSTLDSYQSFLKKIYECGQNIERVLKPGKFCVWNVADFRENGKLRLFHADSFRLFEKAGLEPHDIIIIENLSPFRFVGASAAAMRRRTIKIHEYLCVFRKPL